MNQRSRIPDNSWFKLNDVRAVPGWGSRMHGRIIRVIVVQGRPLGHTRCLCEFIDEDGYLTERSLYLKLKHIELITDQDEIVLLTLSRL